MRLHFALLFICLFVFEYCGGGLPPQIKQQIIHEIEEEGFKLLPKFANLGAKSGQSIAAELKIFLKPRSNEIFENVLSENSFIKTSKPREYDMFTGGGELTMKGAIGVSSVVLTLDKLKKMLSDLSAYEKIHNNKISNVQLFDSLIQNKISEINCNQNKIKFAETLNDSVSIEGFIEAKDLFEAFKSKKKNKIFSIGVLDYGFPKPIKTNKSIIKIPTTSGSSDIKHGNIKYDFKNIWKSLNYMSYDFVDYIPINENLCLTIDLRKIIDIAEDAEYKIVVWFFYYDNTPIYSRNGKYSTYENKQLSCINSNMSKKSIVKMFIPFHEIFKEYLMIKSDQINVRPIVGIFDQNDHLLYRSSFDLNLIILKKDEFTYKTIN